MKEKTSITLDRDLLHQVDLRVEPGASRSALIESILLHWLVETQCEERDRRDVEIYNRHAEALNAEASDVMEFAADLDAEG